MTLRVRALAKINLHLAVGAHRPDGYHDLTTVFQSIALHDTLTLDAHDGPFELRCSDPGLPIDETNLVWRAAAALAEMTGRPLHGLRVTLDKQVPAQAGLGGGSADAMAMLRGLARAWRLELDADVLASLGSRLGADVPFFLHGGTVLGSGRGDELAPLPDLPRYALAIVRPPFGVGTADAYRWLAESRRGADGGATRAPASPAWPLRSTGWAEVLAHVRNDFQPLVAARFPEIGELVTALEARGASLAIMSGSGSAVVGLFAAAGAAAAATAPFAARAGWRAWTSETVDRAAFGVASEVAPPNFQLQEPQLPTSKNPTPKSSEV